MLVRRDAFFGQGSAVSASWWSCSLIMWSPSRSWQPVPIARALQQPGQRSTQVVHS